MGDILVNDAVDLGLRVRELVNSSIQDLGVCMGKGLDSGEVRLNLDFQASSIRYADALSSLIVCNCDRLRVQDLLPLRLVPLDVWHRMSERARLAVELVFLGGDVKFRSF